MFRRAMCIRQPTWHGRVSILRWPATSPAKPSSAARRAATVPADVADASGSSDCSGGQPPPAADPAETIRLSKASCAAPAAAAPAAAAAAAAATGGGGGVAATESTQSSAGSDSSASTTLVFGVSEADAGDVRCKRRYWAEDNAGEASCVGFVAEPRPPLRIEAKAVRKAEAMLGLVLPSGFPGSVHPPYMAYAGWQFTGMAASAAAGVMSTQALLYAMGVGVGALPLAATLNWVIKDGLGQLGGVAFSSLVSTRFDANPKLWRIVAAVSLDASMVLELLSPLAPAYFLPIASVANIGKNVSFLAASASRAAIHNVLSLKGNLADVTAKSGAQTILACMAGTGAGVALSASLGSEFHAIVPACLCLSVVHLGANHMSMRRLGIPTFDHQRLELVVNAMADGDRSRGIPSPQDIAAQEDVVAYAVREKIGLNLSPTVVVGSRLEEAVKGWGELEELCRVCEGLPFLLSVRGDLAHGAGEVHVLLLEGYGTREVLAGSYVALVAKRLLLERGLRRPRGRRRPGTLARGGKENSTPTGDILPEVIEEALRQGAALLATPDAPPSPIVSPSPTDTQGGQEKVGEVPKLQEQGDAARHGRMIAHELSARAERSGWNTSALFLEKAGAVRLRLVLRPEN
ncbi:unnamed protein product [Ectocarpus sp. CCAP 1310/34]|nr:unnamed protein product [Ectocarpus sp. CCAP 1310/34]